METAIPRLRINPAKAEMSGLDLAIVDALADELGEAYDAGVYRDAGQLKTALGVLREAMGGGPLIEYLMAAKAEATAAMAKIAEIDPANATAVIEIQMAIRQFRHLLEWMAKYISVAPHPEAADSPPEDA